METISKKTISNQIAAKTDATKTDINTILTLTSTSLRAMLLKVTRFNWLASVPSNFVTVLLVRVVTHKLVRKLKLLHQTFQHSSQVRASRMKLTSNNLIITKKDREFSRGLLFCLRTCH